jgi:hypothetical protein
MSASTRREKNDRLANLTSLFTKNVQYITEGKRDQNQIQALLDCMQFFKENRLLTGISKQPDDLLPPPEQLQLILSLKLGDSLMPRRTATLLMKNGIEYVGELYLVNWERCDIGGSVKNFLSDMGLPHKLDLAEVNWIPPYANADFYWRMNQPFVLFMQDMILSMPETTHHVYGSGWFLRQTYTGEVFTHTYRTWAYGRGFCLDKFNCNIKPGTKLRAGMYCPKSWQPPAEPPK